MCIGGDLVIVDRKGYVVPLDSNPDLMHSISGAAKVNDDSHTYWYVYDDGKIYGSHVGEGTVRRNGGEDGSTNLLDLEGTAINKDSLAFLGRNTIVEWGMVQNQSGNYGRMATMNSKDQAPAQEIWDGYNTYYHTHPYRNDGKYGPSKEDKASISGFAKNGYKKCTVYEARLKEWIVYYGEKEDGEIYENEM